MFVYFITTRRELQDQPYIRFAAIGTAITVIKPATAMERLLFRSAIDSLPENQRKAIILNKYEDLSYKGVQGCANPR